MQPSNRGQIIQPPIIPAATISPDPGPFPVRSETSRFFPTQSIPVNRIIVPPVTIQSSRASYIAPATPLPARSYQSQQSMAMPSIPSPKLNESQSQIVIPPLSSASTVAINILPVSPAIQDIQNQLTLLVKKQAVIKDRKAAIITEATALVEEHKLADNALMEAKKELVELEARKLVLLQTVAARQNGVTAAVVQHAKYTKEHDELTGSQLILEREIDNFKVILDHTKKLEAAAQIKASVVPFMPPSLLPGPCNTSVFTNQAPIPPSYLQNNSSMRYPATYNGGYKRPSIPKPIRDQVWTVYNGRTMDSTCYCCDKPLSHENWHASHVVAYAYGGEDTVSNLRPCCVPCNTAMGTRDMREYIYTYKLQGRGARDPALVW